MKTIDPKELKPYFSDIFKTCYSFYPTIEYDEKLIRIFSVIKNRRVRYTVPNTAPKELLIPILVTKWKRVYLSKLWNVKEATIPLVMCLNEDLLLLHKQIKQSLLYKNGTLRVKDALIIRDSVKNEIRMRLSQLSYLTSFTQEPVELIFDKNLTVNTKVHIVIDDYSDTRIVQIII